jgi:hypothetical protein
MNLKRNRWTCLTSLLIATLVLSLTYTPQTSWSQSIGSSAIVIGDTTFELGIQAFPNSVVQIAGAPPFAFGGISAEQGLIGADIDTGAFNLNNTQIFRLSFPVPIVNQLGPDLYFTDSRFSSDALDFSLDGGATFHRINVNDFLDTGISSTLRNTGLPFRLFAAKIDMSNYGVAAGASISTVVIRGVIESDPVVVGNLNKTCNAESPYSESITGFPSCGPAAVLSPTWGRFGSRSVLESDRGEKLELHCVQSGINYYALFYTPPGETRVRVGVCPFEGGCNTAFFTHSGDRDNNGKPDCFIRTSWRSRDYANNDIPNPWTRERTENPPVLDHAVSVFNAASQSLTKASYKYQYRTGPPVRGCLPASPAEGDLIRIVLVDPPIGDETEAFFNGVVQLLQEVPPPHAPMDESPLSLADLNGDGQKDEADLQIFLNSFGSCAREARFNPDANLDEDNCVTFADFQIWTQLFSPSLLSDIVLPTITAPSDLSIDGTCSGFINVGVAIASDNIDGQITPVALRSDGHILSEPFSPGVTTITWVATDSSGNSTFAIQTVTVTGSSAQAALQSIITELDEIISNAGSTEFAKKLQLVRDNSDAALQDLNATPSDRQTGIRDIKRAVGDLEPIIDAFDPPSRGIQILNRLAEAARILVTCSLNQAIAEEDDQAKIVSAQKSLAEGDALRAAGKFKEAVNKYKDALSKAESALN